ncbi:MAG TPA: SRPBCC domain-containing protein [Microthrixaceae bacterium]|nr:SRPBCC domain-containing protein [Microthrixaceae bacterium]
MTNTDKISIDQFIARAPERVWEALTIPDQLASWWVPGDIAPVVGHRFTLEMPGWGDVACEMLEVVEPVRLVYTFADWTLTWRLVAEGTGTRLFLDHAGFDLDNPQHRFAFDNMGPGWRDEVLPRLAALVEADPAA